MATCCPNYISGFCLENGTPITLIIENGAQTGWINNLTAVVTAGAPPIGTVSCTVDNINLDCLTDSVTICPGEDAITVDGTVELGPVTLAALETVTVLQGTTPWIVGDGGSSLTVDAVDLDIRNLLFATDSVNVSGSTVALDPATLTALETVTVLQGTSPWTVTGTVNVGTIDYTFDYAEDSPHTSGNVGAFVLAVRNDAGGSMVNNDLEYAPFQVNSQGQLRVTSSPDGRLGTFYLASSINTLTTAADGATAGRFWLVNTSDSVLIKIVEVVYTCFLTDLIDLAPARPHVNMERMTFTGTPSGALITPAKNDSTNPANVATFRTASTGMAITAGAVVRQWMPVTLAVVGGLLAANASAVGPTEQILRARDESGDIILRQNEGLVWRQATAGSGTEARQMQIDLVWEEYPI